jgi:hypothetical protein
VGLARWLPSGDGLTRMLAVLLSLGALALLWLAFTTHTPGETPPTHLSLVLPDGAQQDDVRVRVWRDAADELGFVLDVVGASQLMRQGATQRDAALIVPDGLHRHMNEALLAHLRARVQDGARLMLVHDAGLLDLQGRPHPQQSRLSDLVGVRYALQGGAGVPLAVALRAPQLWVPPTAMDALALAPGLLLRAGSKIPLTTPQTTPDVTERLLLASDRSANVPLPLPLPFSTAGRLDGQLLLGGDGDQVLAASHAAGRGAVLFVNLPLTAMKLQGEGLLLHSLLRHFAQDIAQLPQLSPLPDARGALVMNWYVDSAAAVPAMLQMAKMGVLELGGHSVHISSDAASANDDSWREWLRKWSQREDEVGSHDVDPSTARVDAGLKAVRGATGRPVREQSSHAPAPALALATALAVPNADPPGLAAMLAQRGVLAYRTAADVGAAPTRAYVQGQRGPADVWAFPSLGYGGAVSLEQARANDASENEIGAWLDDVMAYCAEQRVLRTISLHPPAAMMFPQAFERWFDHIQALVKSDRLRLTTLSSHAAFANRRLTVQWQVSFDQGRLRLQATHAISLAHMSWLLPVQGFEAPQIQEGTARVEKVGPYWRITADGVKQLVVTSAALKSDTRQ